jgi:hypothetical protein
VILSVEVTTGYSTVICAPHVLVDGKAVPDPGMWYMPRSVAPAGATLVSTATWF